MKDKLFCLVRRYAKAIGSAVTMGATYLVTHYGVHISQSDALLLGGVATTFIVYLVPNRNC